jgi:hypothetical protein
MSKLTRRKFAFWLGFGLFTLSEKLNLRSLDSLAAAAMRRGRSSSSNRMTSSNSNSNSNSAPAVESAPQEHWIVDEDETWRWFERENYVKGKWRLSGTTVPVNKKTGERKPDSQVYLEDSMVPEEMRASTPGDVVLASHEEATSAETEELNKQLPTAAIRHRNGKPPSEWLRSLKADEIRIWLKTIDVPNTGVNGMTHWTHLTRDHLFDAAHIEGLTIPEQAKLHSAAHFGY